MLRILILAPCLLFCSAARADVIFEVDSVTAVAGTSNVSVSVFARTPDGGTLSGVNMGFDLSPSGSGLPPGISLVGVTNGSLAPIFAPSNDSGIAAGRNIDAHITASLFQTPISASNSSMFNLVFDVGAATAPGTYGLNIVDGYTEFNVTSTAGTSGNALTFTGGSITVTAVPEPSTFGLFALVGGVAMIRRRRA